MQGMEIATKYSWELSSFIIRHRLLNFMRRTKVWEVI